MNIDLLPFSAFALESCAGPAQALGDVQTLTLALGLAPARSSMRTPMAGTAFANRAVADRGNGLSAGVVPGDGSALTITFL